jgi:hypothetical protein
MSICSSEMSSKCEVVCNVASCGRRFATKMNLEKHKREDHKIENRKPGRPKKYDIPTSEVRDDFSDKEEF